MNTGDTQRLIDEAWRFYRHTSLWNLRRPTAGDDLSAMIMSLRRYGNADAWRLAAELDALNGRQSHVPNMCD